MSLLDALDYVGQSLAKPGRAVRGLLGGRPEEALAALPFSDTLGITDPANQVTGRHLLDQLGLTQADDDSLGSTIAGFGVDVATDPLTYLGGAAARLGYKALAGGGSALHIPQELAAARAAEAAAGEFSLADPITKLVNPADELTRGMTSAWEPPTARGSIDLGPLAPMDVPVEPTKSWADVFPPKTADIPHPNQYALAWGGHPDYVKLAEGYRGFLPPGELNTFENGMFGDALHLDNSRETAHAVMMGGWDRALADLQRLNTEGRARLGVPAAARELGLRPDQASDLARESWLGAAWQGLLNRRLGELQGMQRLVAEGAMPAEYLPQIQAQVARMRPFVNDLPSSQQTGVLAKFLRDVDNGYMMPESVVPDFQNAANFSNDAAMIAPHGIYPVDPKVLERLAARGQGKSLYDELRESLHYLEDDFPGLRAESFADVTSPGLVAERLRNALRIGDENYSQLVVNALVGGARHTDPRLTMQRVAAARDMIPDLELRHAEHVRRFPDVLQAINPGAEAFSEALIANGRPLNSAARYALAGDMLQRASGMRTLDELAASLRLRPEELMSIVETLPRDVPHLVPPPANVPYFLRSLPRGELARRPSAVEQFIHGDPMAMDGGVFELQDFT